MSQDDVLNVVMRASSDKEFYKLLRKDPDVALRGYNLTSEERESIMFATDPATMARSEQAIRKNPEIAKKLGFS
jgi:hypothetical protein